MRTEPAMEREAFLQRTAQAKTPLHPAAEMFRDIRCFDFFVEIGEQKITAAFCLATLCCLT